MITRSSLMIRVTEVGTYRLEGFVGTPIEKEEDKLVGPGSSGWPVCWPSEAAPLRSIGKLDILT